MKILANDGLNKIAIDTFKKMNIEIDTVHYEGEELIKILKKSDAVIVRSATKLKKSILQEVINTNLKLIIRAGVGLDNIDVKFAQKNGFTVKNTPNSSANAVAELALGGIISLARFIPIANFTCKNGLWNKKHYQGTEIQGKTLGIIGMGNIGTKLATKANALGMNILFYDEYIEEATQGKKVDFETLLKNSDFISIHAPLIKENFLSSKEFSLMKDGSYLINTSRGANIDEKALLQALDSGKLKACFLDVFKEEPLKNQQLLNHDKIYLTPHIGGSTLEAQEGIAYEIVDIVKNFTF